MERNRIAPLICSVLTLVLLTACSKEKKATQPTANNQPGVPAQQATQPETQPAQTQNSKPGAVAIGEASGSYTSKGEVVQLKYAYAGHGVRFGKDSIIVLLTDKPIPPEALAEELESQTMLLDQKIRGLEYVIESEGFWVRFHPGQYQESKRGTPKEYSLENDIVKGFDEDNGDVTDGKYSRSVRFAAVVTKDK